ncbi:ABC transporter permease [Albidovulum sp.]|uniref:ABC transporter permease n=1 Tax=Albidovulum sp. TaxID=1872424 RepID=UPI001D263588|nr:ABC transporter permease [Paracoccaceae bacterium]MCC0046925.1 ABC transporter permease [Defluviimonas sp.]HPE24601.1 ABC transporter permease [Albidovulum sp.]MCB2119053.1 ABC transporter permease [Paracoccaceae bacterium]MCB2121904.1 ABC transporter permease [Paracoccaceae bacterium]
MIDARPNPDRRRPRIIAALVLRETCARFGRSWGGYAWALAEPVGGIAILSLAFALIAPKPPLGSSFTLFYATGIIPFLMYNSLTTALMAALQANRGLLSYPVVRPLDILVARALLETLTHLAVAAAVLVPVVLALPRPPAMAPEGIALSLGLAAALGTGTGTFNAAIAAIFPTWRQVWSVLNRPVFIISGILFTARGLPDDLAALLWFNPIAHVVEAMRDGVFGPDPDAFVSAPYVLFIAATLFLAGAILIRGQSGKMLQI